MSDRTLAVAAIAMGAVFCYYMLQDEQEDEEERLSGAAAAGENVCKDTWNKDEGEQHMKNKVEAAVDDNDSLASSPPRSPPKHPA